jgi:hypothetical protein
MLKDVVFDLDVLQLGSVDRPQTATLTESVSFACASPTSGGSSIGTQDSAARDCREAA